MDIYCVVQGFIQGIPALGGLGLGDFGDVFSRRLSHLPTFPAITLHSLALATPSLTYPASATASLAHAVYLECNAVSSLCLVKPHPPWMLQRET